MLEQAAELGYRWCLVQRVGNIVLEGWHPDGAHTRLDESVSEWIAERDFLALGAAGNDHCLLVDVRRWEELRRPDLRWLRVDDVGEELDRRCLALGRLSPEERSRLARYLGRGGPDPAGRPGDLARPARRRFPRGGAAAGGRRAARRFPLEPRAGPIFTTTSRLRPPASSRRSRRCTAWRRALSRTSSSNRSSSDARTRVVYFDCSARALRSSASWSRSGTDATFPAFLPRLFSSLPSRSAHYHLWGGAAPETLDPRAADRAWERELESSGRRARVVRRSTGRATRRLRHEFIHGDLLRQSRSAACRGRAGAEHAVIWWSNAAAHRLGELALRCGRAQAQLRAVGG